MERNMKLEMEISDVILKLVDDNLNFIMPRGDVQGVVEASAYEIIKMVKESEEK